MDMEDASGSSSSPASLRNKYWILRHGRSIPNERGLIVSSLENGTKPEFGLAPQGVEQARAAGEKFRKELEETGVPVDSVKIRYSPFSRTTETARVVAGVLGIPFEGPSCQAMLGLRERYFGPSYELLSHDKLCNSYCQPWGPSTNISSCAQWSQGELVFPRRSDQPKSGRHHGGIHSVTASPAAWYTHYTPEDQKYEPVYTSPILLQVELATLRPKPAVVETVEKKRVAIVGAGVSGLAACKHLLERGCRPVVFEAGAVVGGVWARVPDCTALQTARHMYQYSDFPWPDTVTEVFRDHRQVMAYLDAYARRFGRRVLAMEYHGVAEDDVAAWEQWGGNGEAFGSGGAGEWRLEVADADGRVEVVRQRWVKTESAGTKQNQQERKW